MLLQNIYVLFLIILYAIDYEAFEEVLPIVLLTLLKIISKWDKVFKSKLSKFCGRQLLKYFKGYVLLKQNTYHKDCLP